MHTNFGGCDLSGFGDTSTFKNGQISLSDHGLSKNSMDRNQLQKFMQVGTDVKCMHTNFGGCDLSGFKDTATFKNGQISLSDHGLFRKGNLAVFKSSNISETRIATSTKIGVHALHIHTYLLEFFEPIPIHWIFWWPWTIAHGQKGKIGCFWK